MRFGKPSQMLGEISNLVSKTATFSVSSIFTLIGLVSAFLFFIADNAMFLYMFGLLPMQPEMAGAIGKLEVQLWFGIIAFLFLAELLDLLFNRHSLSSNIITIKLGTLVILSLDFPSIMYFTDFHNPYCGPIISGWCGCLSAFI